MTISPDKVISFILFRILPVHFRIVTFVLLRDYVSTYSTLSYRLPSRKDYIYI